MDKLLVLLLGVFPFVFFHGVGEDLGQLGRGLCFLHTCKSPSALLTLHVLVPQDHHILWLSGCLLSNSTKSEATGSLDTLLEDLMGNGVGLEACGGSGRPLSGFSRERGSYVPDDLYAGPHDSLSPFPLTPFQELEFGEATGQQVPQGLQEEFLWDFCVRMDKCFLLVFILFCFIGGVDLQLLYMECQKFCKNLTYDLNGQTYVQKCCNRDYCNFEP
ncbi:Prostate and testis expressed protein 3 [Pteropus alecto]|uniref:Prostate and testis expressed protein 3 n=1 Tax=Pteropus alecto TaxID=9402 RepID=L5KGY9_PTEAL|nr:Prostate and testis expressed protein 3 [Pteropus alecto]